MISHMLPVVLPTIEHKKSRERKTQEYGVRIFCHNCTKERVKTYNTRPKKQRALDEGSPPGTLGRKGAAL